MGSIHMKEYEIWTSGAGEIRLKIFLIWSSGSHFLVERNHLCNLVKGIMRNNSVKLF